jgi:transcriptional regulator with XRE-family HTH domain
MPLGVFSARGSSEGGLLSRTFADRLNRLFDAIYPPGRGPYSAAEVVAALNARGVRTSSAYLSQLRTGARTNPSVFTMAAFAEFFGVETAYFTDEGYFARMDVELSWLITARDEGIRRVATRLVGLSPEAMEEVLAKIGELRRRENVSGPKAVGEQ